MTNEASSFHFFFGFNPNSVIVEGQIVSGDDVSSEEIIAFLWTQFVDVFGDELPERLKTLFLVDCFFKEVAIATERR